MPTSFPPTSQPGQVPRAQRNVIHLNISLPWILILALFFMAPWFLMIYVFSNRSSPEREPAPVQIAAQRTARSVPAAVATPPASTSAGPVAIPHPNHESASRPTAIAPEAGETRPLEKVPASGKLEYTRVTIAPPVEFIQEMLVDPGERKWYFRNLSRQELDEFFQQAGLSDAAREKLWTFHQPDFSADTIFTPNDEFVRELKSSARERIYCRLGLDDRNMEQVNVFRFLGASVDEWLAEIEVPTDALTAIKALSYQSGDYRVFADLRLILPLLPELEQKTRVLKALDSDQTYLVRLRVDATSDIESLVAYWGQGGRHHLVRPMLEGLAKVPGGASTSIRAFLPAFVQTRLNTHPMPTIDPIEKQRDCHWTALNFFSTTPNDQFAMNPENVVNELRNNYYPVFANFQLGDIVLFMTDDEKLYHSAVYIAEDLLFTKNGRMPSTPWMFIRMGEMQRYYAQARPIKLVYYRRKEAMPR